MSLTVTETYVIEPRDSPKSNNAGGGGMRTNPYVAAREKKKWEGLFLAELMARRVPKHMTFCAVDIVVHFKFKSGGKGRDVENFRQPVVKPFADALVKGGYLGDDTAEWLDIRSFELDVPAHWPFAHPGLKSYMTITMEAQYR